MEHQHTTSFMEHGYCFNWEPALVWLHVGADIITGLSYYSIPVAMFYFIWKRRDLPFRTLFLLFASFILSCGTTHLFAAYTVFVPAYWPEGVLKAFTAAISATAAILLIPHLPQALKYPSLQAGLDEIKELNKELNNKNAELQIANYSLEKLLDPIYWVAEDAKIWRVNEAACTSLGYTREELLTMSIPDIDPHFPAEMYTQHWIELKEAGSIKLETQHKTRNGQLRDVEVVANFISFEGREFNCATVRDISDRKKLETMLAHRISSLTSPLEDLHDVQFEDLFDINEIQKIQDAFAAATGVASLITGPGGHPLTKPSNFCHLCRDIIRNTAKGFENCCHSDALIGRINHDGPTVQCCLSGGLWDAGAAITVGDRHLANWLIGQVLDESCDTETMMAYARKIGADEEAYRLALHDVKRMSIDQFKEISNALFLIAGQLSRMAMQNIMQARHINERKRTEQERELLISQLQDKTAEMERFIYTISHDLKSPLITISGFVGFLEKAFYDQDRERFSSTITRISLAAERMKQLLDELLELSRIGRKLHPFETVALSDLLKEALEMIAGRIDTTHAVIEIKSDLPMVTVDRQRLLQVLENLIDNAVKFSSSTGQPKITIGMRHDGPDRVFYVADNGIGIEARYLEKIFELFEKLDARGGGTGVGLAICRRIIEVHGGRIWAESEGLNHGATFCFTLPETTGGSHDTGSNDHPAG